MQVWLVETGGGERMTDKIKYELMYIIKQKVSDRYPNGIDTETAKTGDAIGVIRYLLKHDSSVKDYKLMKRQKRRR